MATVIIFVIGLVLFVAMAGFLWWILFTLAAPLWPNEKMPKAIVFGKVLVALVLLLCFLLWLSNGMPLPFFHRFG